LSHIYTMQDFQVAQELSQLARQTPIPVNFLYPQLFPEVSIRSRTFTWRRNLPKIWMAPFHAESAGVPQLPRRDVEFNEGTLGNIGIERNLRSEQVLDAALAGRLGEVDTEDVQDCGTAIRSTFEYLAMQALTNGSVDISNDRGIVYTLNFGTFGVNTTPGTNWNVYATAKPLNDIYTWAEAIKDKTNYYPAAFLTSQKQVNNIIQCTSVKELVWGWANATGMVSLRQVNQFLSEIHGLPPILVYDQKVTMVDFGDDSESSVRTSNENAFIGLPPLELSPQAGATVLGITPEAAVAYADVQQNLDAFAEGIWVDVLTQRVPTVRRAIRAKAAAIPAFPYIGQTLRAVVQ